ncbi:YicC/YloC family endoribonuclease [Actibacterium sp. MT2.3-13A]|uniref:YicC/YloC family endoribonuclease n=1 Tax=Actibacterium sp. MT2.3-13A TaxID=2828332 RepID=UPI0020133889|nr:YicC/YloC family endoribonuclease [Actibacterium sp. MT2.3-13A]
MTGFAAATGGRGDYRWAWDIRSVNARGLDLRLRLPDWIAGLEQGVRAALTGRLARGNVSLTLRVTREAGGEEIQIDEPAMTAVLSALKRIEAAARLHDLALAPTTAAEVLTMRGVQMGSGAEEDTAPLLKALMADLPALLDDFTAMRAAEGRALVAVLQGQLDTVESQVARAAAAAEARAARSHELLRENLARVMDNAEGADEARVAQELALIAVKADIREELDRLTAHIAAARDLLAGQGPVGRKLDFLMQEFNREANTLCSKAQSTDLTRIGLDLKATIDQMREQVQNVE